MSELISGSKERIEALFQLFSGYIEKKDGRQLWDAYRDKLEALTPADVLLMGDKLMEAGYNTEQITDQVEKIFNIIIPILKEYDWNEPKEGSALYYLMEENLALTNHMDSMKEKIKALGELEEGEDDYAEVYTALKDDFRKLSDFDPHYLKVENVLFPYLEKKWEFSKPLQIIWAVNDEIRTTVKQINYMLDQRDDLRIEEHQVIGSLFMLMMRMTYKENLVIFPAASMTLSEDESREMLPHMADIGFCFIDAPDIETAEPTEGDFSGDIVEMGGTGALSVSQLIMMMNHLPVDITFVDENDEVRYFSNPKDRFFTRSPAIIGRKVQNCHPSDSIDTVNNIVTSFKKGEKDSAKFWIRMQGKVIMINYFAVRDKDGKYKGTIEVSQDITEIQQLEGERRLLEWDE
jgi:PAS domain S-box-containing protein